MTSEQGWTYEVHELSEGFSAIAYDQHGQMIADHLTEERARLIAMAPEMLEAIRLLLPFAANAADGDNTALWAVRNGETVVHKTLGRPVESSTLLEELAKATDALKKIELLSTNHGGWFENDAWRWGQDMGEAARAAIAASGV